MKPVFERMKYQFRATIRIPESLLAQRRPLAQGHSLFPSRKFVIDCQRDTFFEAVTVVRGASDDVTSDL